MLRHLKHEVINLEYYTTSNLVIYTGNLALL